MRRFVARFNFLCTLIGNRPQDGHPFSIAEMLIEKGYEFSNQQTIQGDLLEPDEQSRESHYQMTYTNVTELNDYCI